MDPVFTDSQRLPFVLKKLEQTERVVDQQAAEIARLRKAIEGWSEDWHGCVYIDLPTGQASWHYHDSQAWMFSQLPSYQGEWDGHTTDEKYRRIEDLTVKHLRDANQEAWNAIKALGESRQRLLGALAVLVSDGVISSSRARELGGMTISEQRAYLRAAIDAAMGGEG